MDGMVRDCEEQSTRWRRLGELALEDALLESDASAESVQAVIRQLDSAGREIKIELLDKLAAELGVNDARGVLLAVIGRGESRVKSLWLERDQDSHVLLEIEALALCVNLESNTRVEEVTLRHQTFFGSPRGCELVGNALATNEALRKLFLPGTAMGPDAVKRLTNHLKKNKTLHCLDIGDNPLFDEGVSYVAEMMRSNRTFHKLQLHNTECGKSGAECLAHAFECNTSLREFTIGDNPLHKEGTDILLKPFVHDGDPSSPKNVTLRSLAFECVRAKHFSLKSLADVLRTNRTLSSIVIRFLYMETEDWVDVMIPALELNETLKVLDVMGCGGLTEGVAWALMKLVQVGKTGLEQINVVSTGISSQGGLINEELRKNKEYRRALRDQPMVPSKSGRVVMCGYEFAGKTTICRTTSGSLPARRKLMWKKFLQSHSHVRQFLYGRRAHFETGDRTRGFDILKIGKGRDVMCIWDFAGQTEYYVLHDYLFPNSGNSCFLYVCSARSSPDDRGKRPIKEEKKIMDEFVYWLRFIASNSKLVQEGVPFGERGQLPHVTFILTNRDTLTTNELDKATQRARRVFHDCKQKFESWISFPDDVHFIDGLSLRDVKKVFKTVKLQLDRILDAKQEYAACEDVRRILRDWAVAHPSFPLLSVDEFNTKVRKALSTEVREKVLAYLNDTGEIIFVEGFRYIVVNPRWFGVGLLGHLISIGQHRAFDYPATGECKLGVLGCFKTLQEGWPSLEHTNGFVTRDQIGRLLQKSLEAVQKSPNSTISIDELIELMIKLEITFEEGRGGESTSLFIPALFNDLTDREACEGKRQLTWRAKFPRKERIHFVGRRLECKDTSRTFLTPGFFPRLQVVLRNYLCGQGWDHFEVARNLIYFVVDGKEVQIEYSGDFDYYVDILIKYSSPGKELDAKAQKTTRRFLEEHLVTRIREFCASPQGCQGVELAEAVIRPVCLRGTVKFPQPFLCIDRQPHAVRISILEEGMKGESRKAYRHTWKETLEEVYDIDFALDLLEGEGSYKRFVAASQVTQTDGSLVSNKAYVSRPDPSRSCIQLPKRFFLTIEDVGFITKIESMMNSAKAVPIKLHLMCDGLAGLNEGKNGPHKVAGQPGRMMKLNEKSDVRNLPILKYAVRLLWIGVKVAAGTVNVALNNIQEMDDWVRDLFNTKEIPIDFGMLQRMMGSCASTAPTSKVTAKQILKLLKEYMEMDPETEWLNAFLNLKVSSKFSADFQLTKVKCIHDESDIRWLCQRHFELGFRKGWVKSVPH